MTRPGMPQSQDLMVRQRRAAVLVGVAGLLVLGMFVLFGGADKAKKLAEIHAMPTSYETKMKATEQTELHEALLAVRHYVSKQVDPEQAESVQWRDTRHQGHNGYFVIEGYADFEFGDGETQTLFYRVTTVRKNGVWGIENKTFKAIPGSP